MTRDRSHLRQTVEAGECLGVAGRCCAMSGKRDVGSAGFAGATAARNASTIWRTYVTTFGEVFACIASSAACGSGKRAAWARWLACGA
jgi:hypothetical protein